MRVNVDQENQSEARDDKSYFNDSQAAHSARHHDFQEKKEKHAYEHHANRDLFRKKHTTVDYNHKLYERAAKKAAYWNEENIDKLKISIESKMATA